MKKNNVKIAACAMAAVIAFGGTGLEASASGNVASVLPSAGIDFPYRIPIRQRRFLP